MLTKGEQNFEDTIKLLNRYFDCFVVFLVCFLKNSKESRSKENVASSKFQLNFTVTPLG